MILISNANENHVIERTINELGIETARLSLTEMPHADYAFACHDGRTVGIERKTLSDLASSHFSGRLDEQLTGCHEDYDKVGLLVEITFMPELCHEKSPLPTILAHRQALGVDVHISFGLVDSGYVLAKLYRMAQQPEVTTLKGWVRKKPQLFRPDPRVETLLAISMVGRCRLSTEAAKKVVKKWGSPAECLAHVDEWTEIDGVGKGIVENMKVVMNNGSR